MFSATGKVIALLADALFLGEAEGHLGGAGTLAIHSQKDPSLVCRGRFTSSAELGGIGQLECSEGGFATFRFRRLSLFSGYGTGTFDNRPMSFAYGLSAEAALPYLKLPAGKKLTESGSGLALVDL